MFKKLSNYICTKIDIGRSLEIATRGMSAWALGMAWAACIALPSSVNAQPATPAAVPYDARVKEFRDDLLVPLREKGEIRVIVGTKASPQFVGPAAHVSDNGRERDVFDSQDRVLSRLAGRNVRQVKRLRHHHFVGMTVDAAALNTLLADPDVESVAEDRRVYPVLNETSGITKANLAWQAGFTGAGQAVAVLDSGVETTHPFFAGKVLAGACFSTASTDITSYCLNGGPTQIAAGAGNNCPDLALGCWHGTHVAGIAVGQSGVLSPTAAGMAPGANLIPIQVFVKDCSGASCAILAYDSDLLAALEYVLTLKTRANNPIAVAAVNMSLGGGQFTAACDASAPGLTTVITSLRTAGVATVIAAGNNGNPAAISYPACISKAISVGSTTKQNTISSFSNNASFLSLLAPGNGIVSSYPGGQFVGSSGTSMATPHVAGAWALLKSAKPTATVTELLTVLQNTGLPISDTRVTPAQVKSLIQLGYDNSTLGALGTLLGHGNIAPTVSLTAPANNATFTAPANVTLTASAADSDGSIAMVEFFQRAIKISQVNNPGPYSIVWGNVPAGSYTLTAKATDNLGGVATSTPISIVVAPGLPTYAISGTVSTGGNALAGVSFTAAGSPNGSCSASNALGLYSCTVPQGWSGNVTPALAGYIFLPPSNNYSTVTANQTNQNYVAAANPDTVWMDDAVPVGATLGEDGDSWTWVSANPAPFSGTFAHQSALAAGKHQHAFYGASNTLSVGVGETLFTYIYLDPVNPPSQIVLQWNDGSSWEHRAYWGADLIVGWGVNGTASRYPMGPLPPVGQWVRLEVPASLVGLEGRTLNGMAFALYGGRATWDRAGKSSAAVLPTFTVSGTVVANGTGLSGVNFTALGNPNGGCTASNAAGQYSCTVPQGWSGTVNPLLSGYTFTPPSVSYNNVTVNQTAQNYTAVAAVLPTYTISGTVTAGGSALAGVSFTAAGSPNGSCSASNALGLYSCTVPQGWSGNVTPALAGYIFLPPSNNYSTVTANQTNQNYVAAANPDTVWMDDAVPVGATLGEDGDSWTWVSANPAPFSGTFAHQSALAAGKHQHAFYGASNTLSVGVGETLFTYIYLDPVNPPSQIVLQWNDGSSWEHRAYWGADLIVGWGVNGTASRYPMGPLPPVGQWVRLEVPASLVGLEGRTLNGMAFALYGGRATWDQVGKR